MVSLCATSAELVVHRSTNGPETSSLPGRTGGSASLPSGRWASGTTRPASAVRAPAPLLGETDRDLNPNTFGPDELSVLKAPLICQ